MRELTPAELLRADVKLLKVYVFLEDGVISASASHSYVGNACQEIISMRFSEVGGTGYLE